eukprot:jgi/Galph1/5555/GphlegSOOS_G4188.1
METSSDSSKSPKENLLSSLYQQLKTLQYPGVQQALQTTPRGKEISRVSIEPIDDVNHLKAIAIALKNELTQTTQEVECWKSQYQELQNDSGQWRERMEEQIADLTVQLHGYRSRAETAEDSLKETEKQLQYTKERREQELKEVREREEKFNTDLSQLRKALDDVQTNKRRTEDSMKRQIESLTEKIHNLETENEKAVSEAEDANIQVSHVVEPHLDNSRLRKELESARKEIDYLKRELVEAEDAKYSLQILREQSEELVRLVSETTGSQNIEDALQYLRDMCVHQKEQVDERYDLLNKKMNTLEEKNGHLQDELRQKMNEIQQLQSRCNRYERQKKLFESERNGYQKILKEYEEALDSEKTTDKVSMLETVEQQKKELERTLEELMEKDKLIAMLEEQVEALQSMTSRGAESENLQVAQSLRSKIIENRKELKQLADMRDKLSEELEAKSKENEELHSLLENDRKKIQDLKQSIVSLQQKIEKHAHDEKQIRALEETVERLERYVSSGYFNPRYTKVLHLKDGPTLPKTCSVEKKRRYPSTESKQEDTHLVNSEESSWSTGKNQALSVPLSLSAEKWKEKALDAEKRAQRTREVAKTKINEFRETCYHLFGWKIHVVGTQYRLSSMYAESSDEILCFGKSDSSGGIELLETDYCRRIQKEIEQYCSRWNSVPALLATITLENFQKTTAVQQ